jgi:hypothetical protein
MSAIIKINGVDALMCWDSGSQLECISLDFTRAVGLQPTPKSKSIKIQLGTKGSSSATSYEVTLQIETTNLKVNHRFDVVNLHKWDALLSNMFCNRYKVLLNYNTRCIRFGDNVIPALNDEEKIVHKPYKARLAAMHD